MDHRRPTRKSMGSVSGFTECSPPSDRRCVNVVSSRPYWSRPLKSTKGHGYKLATFALKAHACPIHKIRFLLLATY